MPGCYDSILTVHLVSLCFSGGEFIPDWSLPPNKGVSAAAWTVPTQFELIGTSELSPDSENIGFALIFCGH
jgi:hypothetical protein